MNKSAEMNSQLAERVARQMRRFIRKTHIDLAGQLAWLLCHAGWSDAVAQTEEVRWIAELFEEARVFHKT